MLRVSASMSAGEFLAALARRDRGEDVLLVDDDRDLARAVVEVMKAASFAPLAATASPVPCDQGPPHAVAYDVAATLPPPPTLATPCQQVCLLAGDALDCALPALAATVGDWRAGFTALGEQLVRMGFRHVASPGVALAWTPAATSNIRGDGAWGARVAREQVGPANVGLETHRLWAATRLRPLALLIDGACLTDDPHTGTQLLVLEVARWMSITRPDARVAVAVGPRSLHAARAALRTTSMTVVPRTGVPPDCDVVYRPYQVLRADDLRWLQAAGQRLLVSQLDMIGYSNPFYHPSPELFFFARNLQRRLMRLADGVTFISEFARRTVVSECPDLDPQRLHVVSCGADVSPPHTMARPAGLAPEVRKFIVCLAATFWHKNRHLAIASFAEMVERHGYDGHLVIAGPAPYYGRSDEADDRLLAGMPADVRRRVVRVGRVSDSEKWWLLREAQAVLYPSIVEGFGLVPFEAAAVSTPCLAYDGAAAGEVLTGVPTLLSTWEPSDWAAAAVDVINDGRRRDAALDAVRLAALGHTWRQCAALTWNAVDSVLASPRRRLIADEGGPLAQVSPGGRRTAQLLAPRFLTARVTAAGRRVIAARRRR